MRIISRQRLLTIILLVAIVPIGFFTKFYSGPAHEWINNSLGGLLYEIFWCLVLYLFFPGAKPSLLAGIVLISTCTLEFLQLWHPPLLEYLRSNFIGRTIIGNAFNWKDIPHYIIGSCLGFLLLRFLKLKSKSESQS